MLPDEADYPRVLEVEVLQGGVLSDCDTLLQRNNFITSTMGKMSDTFSQHITWHPQGKQVGGGGGRQEIEKVEKKRRQKRF